jgi:hypothetical protein
MSKQVGYVILGVCGVIFILGASIFLGLFDRIIDKKIEEVCLLVLTLENYRRIVLKN